LKDGESLKEAPIHRMKLKPDLEQIVGEVKSFVSEFEE